FGRDYFDVQPLKGLFAGDVQQTLNVAVLVRIVNDV
ncbi:MAG: transglutaminase family protein, partial [Zetaproteobacteria bacterium CG_4_8_14_3_um_filter_59_5]